MSDESDGLSAFQRALRHFEQQQQQSQSDGNLQRQPLVPLQNLRSVSSTSFGSSKNETPPPDNDPFSDMNKVESQSAKADEQDYTETADAYSSLSEPDSEDVERQDNPAQHRRTFHADLAPPTRPNSSKPTLPPRPTNTALSSDSLLLKPPLPARPKSAKLLNFDNSQASMSNLARKSEPHDRTSSSGSLFKSSSRISVDKDVIYPDSSNSNRRPPRLQNTSIMHSLTSKNYIQNGVIGRGYLCAGHGSLRIWNLTTGDIVHHIALGKSEAKITAMSFVPANQLDLDQRFLWVGLSDGELWLINVFTGEIEERRISAHYCPVIHILRYKYQMWTLDENGVLQIWSDRGLRQAPQASPFPNIPEHLTRNVRKSSSSSLTNATSAYSGYIVSFIGRRPKTVRVATKQNIAIIVHNSLWTATDRIIEISSPLDSSSVLKKRIEIPVVFGAITCLGMLSFEGHPGPLGVSLTTNDSNVDTTRVYTGHLDGKIIEWDADSFTRRRIIDLGSYRITAILGLGERHLWVGFGTGKIIILDVNTSKISENSGALNDIVVLKELQCEVNDPIESLIFDETSLIHGTELVVASISKSGHVQFWDGLLSLDHIDMEMKLAEPEIFDFFDVSLFIGSWNIDSCKPEDLESNAVDKYFLDKYVTSVPEGADIYAFGFQEIVNLESKKVAAKGLLKTATSSKKSETESNEIVYARRAEMWKERLVRALRDNFKQPYRLLDTKNLVGLFTCVFVREELNDSVDFVSSCNISTGLGGTYGNKGGIVTRFLLNETSFCFITAHLPAHQEKVGKRNVDAITILRAAGLSTIAEKEWAFIKGGDGSNILDHEHVFFFGDLNYRIDVSREKAISLIDSRDWKSLWEADQLIKQRNLPNTTCLLRIFEEGTLSFAPTYKYDTNSTDYDTSEKRRIPAWCDRILFRDGYSRSLETFIDPRKRKSRHVQPREQTEEAGRITLNHYKRYECLISDHRPISALFNLKCKRKRENVDLVEIRQKICTDWLNGVKSSTILRHNVWWLMERSNNAYSKEQVTDILKQNMMDIAKSFEFLLND